MAGAVIKTTELLAESSSSGYMTDTPLSRFTRLPEYTVKGKWELEHPIFGEVGVRIPYIQDRKGKWESEHPMYKIRYSGRGTHFDSISSNLRARLFAFLTSVIKSISG